MNEDVSSKIRLYFCLVESKSSEALTTARKIAEKYANGDFISKQFLDDNLDMISIIDQENEFKIYFYTHDKAKFWRSIMTDCIHWVKTSSPEITTKIGHIYVNPPPVGLRKMNLSKEGQQFLLDMLERPAKTFKLAGQILPEITAEEFLAKRVK